jgi:hypothetical protein
MQKLTKTKEIAALIALSLLISACAGASSPPSATSASFDSAGHHSRIESIVSQWEKEGGSRTTPTVRWKSFPPEGAAVSAAWWGFKAADATDSLQAAVDSGASVVVVPRMPTPWILSRTLDLRSGQVELLLEAGVVVLAAEGAFRGGGDSLIEARGAADFSILGYGASLRMRKKDYQNAPYERAEWRHAISLRGVSRVRIAGLSIESSGGDGVYVGTNNHAPCEDLVLQDLDIVNNHRQGVSVISARHFLIENCHIVGTSGARPMSGIDFEPNSGDPGFTDCVIRGCRIERNAGVGLLIVLSNLGPETEPVSIRVEGCTIDNFPIAVWLHGLEGKVRGDLTFSGSALKGMRFLRGSSDFSVVSRQAP